MNLTLKVWPFWLASGVMAILNWLGITNLAWIWVTAPLWGFMCIFFVIWVVLVLDKIFS